MAQNDRRKGKTQGDLCNCARSHLLRFAWSAIYQMDFLDGSSVCFHPAGWYFADDDWAARVVLLERPQLGEVDYLLLQAIFPSIRALAKRSTTRPLVVTILDGVFGLFLLYWLNTQRVRAFFSN
jgi:hypothetical protein